MSNIHGLFSSKDKKPRNEGEDSDGEDDNNQGQSFYVGGSDHSGQEVLGPSRDVASQFFEAAQRAGAEQISPEEAEALIKARENAEKGTSSSYQPGTYRLGGHGIPTENVSISQSFSQQQPDSANNDRTVRVHLIMWADGFSIDDGPLRRYDDPENRTFLAALMQKRTPPELNRMYPNRKIDLHMERRESEYVPPKAKPFSGSGQRLGSVVPNVVGESSNQVVDLEPDEQPVMASPEEVEKYLQEAQQNVGLNESEPFGRIQIRVGNNPPLVGRFNHTHTVLDLRNFIVTAQPTLAFQPFSLLSGRPPRPIEDEKQSLKDADIINSIVLVKFV